MHDKIEWVGFLVQDGVSRDEAIDMAVDFFGLDAAEESRLAEECDFWMGKPKKGIAKTTNINYKKLDIQN